MKANSIDFMRTWHIASCASAFHVGVSIKTVLFVRMNWMKLSSRRTRATLAPTTTTPCCCCCLVKYIIVFQHVMSHKLHFIIALLPPPTTNSWLIRRASFHFAAHSPFLALLGLQTFMDYFFRVCLKWWKCASTYALKTSIFSSSSWSGRREKGRKRDFGSHALPHSTVIEMCSANCALTNFLEPSFFLAELWGTEANH